MVYTWIFCYIVSIDERKVWNVGELISNQSWAQIKYKPRQTKINKNWKQNCYVFIHIYGAKYLTNYFKLKNVSLFLIDYDVPDSYWGGHLGSSRGDYSVFWIPGGGNIFRLTCDNHSKQSTTVPFIYLYLINNVKDTVVFIDLKKSV